MIYSSPLLAVEPDENTEAKPRKILVIGALIEARLDDHPQTPYRVLLEKILPADRSTIEYRRLPLHRTVREFGDQPRACILPTSIDILSEITGIPHDHMVQSLPIDRVSSHLFTRPGTPTLPTVGALHLKSIVVRQGAVQEHFLRPGLDTKVVRTTDNLSALKMLLAGRADALYSWVPDIYDLADRYGLKLPEFDPSLTVYATNIHLTCKKVPEAIALLAGVNNRISALKASGELRKILGPHAHIVE